MVPPWRLAYSYSKTSGILAKSFLGPRVKRLAECQNAHELYGLVFDGIPPQLPVPELIDEAGRALSDKLDSVYRLMEKLLGVRSEFLARTVRRVEYMNAATIVRSLRRKDTVLPPLRPAGGYVEIRREAYPDPHGLFRGTRFEWLAKAAFDGEIWEIENRLDRQYYAELLESTRTLPIKDRFALKRIVAMEARFQNTVWALRLSLFYGMERERIAQHLIDVPGMDLSKEALEAVLTDPDDRSAWSSWSFSFLVNEDSRRPSWRIDPTEVERAASMRLYAALRRLYHSGPFSLSPAYAFIRLKQREGDFIRSSFEGMRMSLGPRELAEMLGVAS